MCQASSYGSLHMYKAYYNWLNNTLHTVHVTEQNWFLNQEGNLRTQRSKPLGQGQEPTRRRCKSRIWTWIILHVWGGLCPLTLDTVPLLDNFQKISDDFQRISKLSWGQKCFQTLRRHFHRLPNKIWQRFVFIWTNLAQSFRNETLTLRLL